MKNNPIEIVGITSEEEISKYNIQYPYEEFCKSYTIKLTKSKPKIGQILKVSLEPKISEWKYIFTQGQYKIFIEGVINIKVLFLENPYDENIYSTEISRIISGFLTVESDYTDSLKPTLFIEEAFITPLNGNKFSVSLLIAMGIILQIEDENVKEYTKVLDVEDDFKEELQYNNSEDNFKGELQYNNEEDNSGEVLQYDNEEDNFKEELQYDNIEYYNPNEEMEYEHIEDAQYEEVKETNLQYENEEYKNTEASNLQNDVQHEDVENIKLKEEVEHDDIKDADFSEADMEKLRENSINIDVEYDMNLSKNDF
ncbi:hypothetical protein K8O96_16985 [Clostridium sporogenes]|uniref:Uncharacterized protein n=1 Tax=Clostridium botulinum TaxID=1491 RepID=A0A6M0SXT3_CLOBO|nr:hypothetical protein [Clostridium sporogenes]NFA60308.1 hypothetical protein [Clostridium botulinum]NFI72884.1 hypothetical protein [Clostridium sporogenes]NFL73140.1 hypothetical protein [Clostridium sporogenes]NFM22925.1 hypothetical protein [Clostridium sporogenes]NFP60297.1 hypothetical protein [Clostridium sporogenes]